MTSWRRPAPALRPVGSVLAIVFAVALVTTSCAATDPAGALAERPPPTSTSTVPAPGETPAATVADTADPPPPTTPASIPPALLVAEVDEQPVRLDDDGTVRVVDWPRQVMMAFSGDTLPHSPLRNRAERNAAEAGKPGFDFDPMLAGLRPVVAAVDLAVCHLETPIAPIGEQFTTAPRYGVPEQIADAIVAAGYDRCSLASNHTADRGTAGIDRTVAVMESRRLGFAGMARTPAEIEPRLFIVNDVALSHLSYTFSFNGLRLPEGEEWRSALIDPARIIADAAQARAIGAEVVMVSLHWGTEGQHEPTEFQRTVADQITASGSIDIVIGHHAHVLQPIERINGTWVLFGLGNILSNLPTSDRWPAASQDAAVVTVNLAVDPEGGVRVDRPVAHPTWVDKDNGWTALLVQNELARGDLSAGQRARLQASLDRTAAILGPYLAR